MGRFKCESNLLAITFAMWDACVCMVMCSAYIYIHM